MKKMPLSQRIAYGIRVCAVPPVMATILILLVWFNGQEIRSLRELLMSAIFLILIPIAAYPVSYAFPKLRKGGRKTQRNVAFCFSGAGYVAAVIYGIVFHKSQGLNFIYFTYLISVLLLVLINRFSKTRASGHACSVIWPVIIACYYYGLIGAIIGVLIYLAILWSSLSTKRHTAVEFLLGTFVCIVAAGISAFLIFVLELPI